MFFNRILNRMTLLHFLFQKNPLVKKAKELILSLSIAILCLAIVAPSVALADASVIGSNPFIGDVETHIGTLEFESNGYPTSETITKL
ncbi:MAG: hypothetical protein F6K25_12260 [Okeania sp. SIO2G4]|uniref:hypothetical protein n=1 Tax=unclassified Okeania TaxID=2634635 RepID=UPI0013BA02C4|nr:MULTISPECIES: hypothetical protein [unclassified Okeania]NEP04119.1 hypothetical protein [Okeania sp. SIO4D6]NEP72514.1 hypothetical protein [Okeania sp. SIO2G5]NEP93334.1 hypothetical protein [Okeania sp. SIO2F5]NEQ91441.1 hypothetical protein [Okeania sp. SIO2G4]